jgi:hypothetical protein
MYKQPIKEISNRVDSIASDVEKVSNRVIAVTKIGMVAFVLISIVAVAALIVASGRR